MGGKGLEGSEGTESEGKETGGRGRFSSHLPNADTLTDNKKDMISQKS